MQTIKTFYQLVLACLIAFSAQAHANENVTIFAAASLTNALTEIVHLYTQQSGVIVQKSFGSSGTLAKQIEQGAPADLFISADTQWMDYLRNKHVIDEKTVFNLLGNELVLISPKGKSFNITMTQSFKFSGAFSGKICTGDTLSVPVGIYAKQALTHLNWWRTVQHRLVGTQDVRAALALVERGECDVGVVYKTDAIGSEKVEIIGTFPNNSHDPIVYPLSMTQQASPEAKKFYAFLKSEQVKYIFKKFGFQ